MDTCQGRGAGTRPSPIAVGGGAASNLSLRHAGSSAVTSTQESCKGGFFGMPATGKAIDVQLIDIIRVGDDGRAHEHWGVMDQLTMLQQLGMAPEGPPGG
jgi:hypothetical protein